MIATSAPFTEVIEGVVQEYVWTVTFGGVLADLYPDLTLAVVSLELDTNDNNSTVPDQSRYQVGIPDMSGTLVLKGLVDQSDASKTAGWLFRRWNPASPLQYKDAINAPVMVDLGVATTAGAETVRKATMWIDRYVTNRDDTVTFTLKDRWSTLRATPQLPAVVTEPPYNAGLTSEFAIDWLLRAASGGAISSWPAQRPSVFLAAGMRSSVWAEVGLLDTNNSTKPVFTSGVFGTASTASAAASFDETTWTVSPPGAYIFFECWVQDCDATFFFISDDLNDEFLMQANSTLISPHIKSGGVVTDSIIFPTAASDALGAAGPHYFSFHYHQAVGSTSWTVDVVIDETTWSSGAQTASGPRTSNPLTTVTIHRNHPMTIEAVQATEESSPASNFGFVQQAFIGESLNPLQVVPSIDAATSDSQSKTRDTIQQIAAAELALAYFDESGIFHYRNRRDIRTDLTVARTITSDTALADIDEETIAAAVINRARPGCTGWNFGAAAQLWSLSKVWRIPAKSTVTKIVNAPSGTLWCNIDTDVALLPDSGVATAGNSYYRASTDAAGTHNHPGLTIVPTLLTSTQLQIEITNDHGIAAYTAASADNTDPDAGTAVLIIGGVPVTSDDEVQVDFQYPPKSVVGSNGLRGAAGTRFGEVPWDDTGNPWRQDPDATLQLAQDVVCDASMPRPNLNSITLAFPDFRLQLADLVGISDLDRTLIVDYARIFGWTINFSGTERSMVIDGRTLAAPFGWIGGLPGRSEGGTTTIGFSGAA